MGWKFIRKNRLAGYPEQAAIKPPCALCGSDLSMMAEAGALDPADETFREYESIMDTKYLEEIRAEAKRKRAGGLCRTRAKPTRSSSTNRISGFLLQPASRTVVLKLKTREFKILTRSHTPNTPPSSFQELTAIALALRERVDLGSQQRYRLVGVGLSNFRDPGVTLAQPTLFE